MKNKILLTASLTIISALTLHQKQLNYKAPKSQYNESGIKQQPDTHVTDTLDYIKTNFINKKANYIGKPFSVLLNDLKLNINYYTYGDAFNNRSISPDISISFVTEYQKWVEKNSTNKPIVLTVTWATPVSIDSAVSLGRNSKGKWLNAEKKYYGGKIVKDLGLLNW